jgi:hypothetical protein
MKRTRTFSTNILPKTSASNVRSAFYRQVPSSSAPTDAGTSLSGPPLVFWLCRQEPSFRHGVTHTRYALDSNAFTVLTEALEPHAAYRLLQLSYLRAHLGTFQTSPHIAMANHRANKWTYNLRSTSNRVFTGQGLHHFGDNVSPHHGNRSPRWIYPNLIDSDTTCR